MRRHRLIFAAAVSVAALLSFACDPVRAAGAEDVDDAATSTSLLGGYLAGRVARSQNDTASAAAFYGQALEREPQDDLLMEQALLMQMSEGNWPRAIELSRKLTESQPTHRLGSTLLAVAAFKDKRYPDADRSFAAAASGTIGELTATLARAWVKVGTGDATGAMAMLDGARPAEWPQFYLRYHRALIADIAGKSADAKTGFDRIFKTDPRTPRIALAYARSLAHAGDLKGARAVLKENIDKSGGEGQPMVRDLLDRMTDGGAQVPLLVGDANQGLSEVFYSLGEALTAEGGVSIGTIYLQLALMIEPKSPFALAALANVYESTKRYDKAISTYGKISKDTPLETAVAIRTAINLNQLDRVDEAKDLLEKLARQDPSDLRPLDALGTIMRARKRFAEAADYYTRAIALISKPEKRHWTYWYARGTSYERLKKWPQAEADLVKALQLYPDQPLVLNYLGYSWVDQGRNLKQGMTYIEKAVSLKPDDGYIVDSLGWAHYRQKNYKEAVRWLERAVELRPEDAVLNDHLGDALWRVGRSLEARYQWEMAISLKPEPEDLLKMQHKLKDGLPDEKISAKPPAKTKTVGKSDAPKKRAQSDASPAASWPF
jgi:tetratricopeptide (TPR) repeat protein